RTYEGGGFLVLNQSSGATILNGPLDPNQPSLFGVTSPATFSVINSVHVPHLEGGDAIPLMAIAQKKDGAIFKADVVAVDPNNAMSAPEPLDQNLANNSKTEELTTLGNAMINNTLLDVFLGQPLSQAQVVLDSNDSVVNVPGMADLHFQ